MKRSTTEQMDKEICRLYRETSMSQNKIAAHFGIGPMTVGNVLRRNNVPKDTHRLRPYDVNSAAFDDLGQEGAAYWLGFLFADGTVAGPCVKVALARRDAEHVRAFARFLGCDREPAERSARLQDRSYPVSEATICDRELADKLRDLGIDPHRTMGNRALKRVPKAARHHFLRGWFDGDGSVLVKPIQMMFCGPEPMVRAAAVILDSEAGTKPVKFDPVGIGGKAVRITYGGAYRCRDIADYLYRDATIWLPRKRERINAWPKPTRTRAKFFCPTCGHKL